MKKSFIIIAFFVSLSSFAKSMDDFIGLGIGWSNSAYLFEPNTYVTKLGVTPNLVLEPEFYLAAQRDEFGDVDTQYGISLLLAPTIRQHEKTNLYLKGGLSFDVNNPARISATSYLGLVGGFGIEHFISDYFSIDLSALSSYIITSYGEDYGDISSPYDFYLGNGNLRVAVLWYY